MTLQNNFFRILSETHNETADCYEITLNPDHFIFKAHFPGNPITPGVCQLAMVEELLSAQIGQPLLLDCVNNIKYMNIISPIDVPQLQVRISHLQPTDGGYSLQAVLANDTTSFTKMSIRLAPKA